MEQIFCFKTGFTLGCWEQEVNKKNCGTLIRIIIIIINKGKIN